MSATLFPLACSGCSWWTVRALKSVNILCAYYLLQLISTPTRLLTLLSVVLLSWLLLYALACPSLVAAASRLHAVDYTVLKYDLLCLNIVCYGWSGFAIFPCRLLAGSYCSTQTGVSSIYIEYCFRDVNTTAVLHRVSVKLFFIRTQDTPTDIPSAYFTFA